MIRVIRVELLVITDELDPDDVVREIEQARYPNDCLTPKVVSMEAREVEWTDDHPLNKTETWRSEFRKMFGYDCIGNARFVQMLEDLP